MGAGTLIAGTERTGRFVILLTIGALTLGSLLLGSALPADGHWNAYPCSDGAGTLNGKRRWPVSSVNYRIGSGLDYYTDHRNAVDASASDINQTDFNVVKQGGGITPIVWGGHDYGATGRYGFVTFSAAACPDGWVSSVDARLNFYYTLGYSYTDLRRAAAHEFQHVTGPSHPNDSSCTSLNTITQYSMSCLRSMGILRMTSHDRSDLNVTYPT